jgi:hypothetical protein
MVVGVRYLLCDGVAVYEPCEGLHEQVAEWQVGQLACNGWKEGVGGWVGGWVVIERAQPNSYSS